MKNVGQVFLCDSKTFRGAWRPYQRGRVPGAGRPPGVLQHMCLWCQRRCRVGGVQRHGLPSHKSHQQHKPKFHLTRHVTSRHDTLFSPCILAQETSWREVDETCRDVSFLFY